MRRLLFAVFALALAGLGVVVLPGSGASASTGYCTSSKGVTVVVDFSAFGGGVEIACDTSATSSTTGVSALQATGFNPAGTTRYELQFICRLRNLPSTKVENCINTPPATAYWSYWYAPNGGSWTYATQGASTHHVITGGFEGWRFHKGGGDASAPGAQATRPVVGPVPTVVLGPAASTKGAAPKSSTSSSSSSTSKTKSPTASKTASPTPSATSTDPSTEPDGTSTSASDQAGGPLAGGEPPGGSSPWPFVLGGIGILCVLGGAGVVVARRRGSGGF